MTEATTPTTAAIVIEGVTASTERPLSRRELRERERRQQSVVPREIADTVENTPREVAAPASADAHHDDYERVLTGVPTRTTEIPLPSRAALRSARRATESEESAEGAVLSTVPAPRSTHAAASVSLPATAPLPIIATPVVSLAPAAPAPLDVPGLLQTTAPAEAQSVTQRRARARSARPAAGHRTRPPRTRWVPTRRGAAKGVTVAAMTIVALMAVSTSVPAEALLSFEDVQSAAVAARQTDAGAPSQTLNLASGPDIISVQRDGYESQTVAEVAAASGIRLEADFTNNPNGTIQWPFAVGVHIGDHFGYRDCAGCSANHHGQDFNPGFGAPIQAIADGVVHYTEDGEGSLGVHMVIDHHIDGELVSSVYAHMEHGSMQFREGDHVKVGDVIGYTGNTGMSTGPHLHFEIRIGGIDGTYVDPLEWLYAHVD
ncbi:hypothetical protein EEJ31_09405 [Cryobacterium tepidiphilum]|uniref:M23ase beta-sheet core domain-containing protein n=2 Tax=Cryobacterium tepidiphilum TaxID=2486026 RepID=A0A3M8LBH9_9MICO|nr:hypothetical protein EEJ31_09405 [Cryobacterium tepidiphilum]